MLAQKKAYSNSAAVVINSSVCLRRDSSTKIHNPHIRSKVDYISETPFQRTLYLDADTRVCEDLTHMFELLDSPNAGSEAVKQYLTDTGKCDIETEKLFGEKGSTDHIKITIAGSDGRSKGGQSPTSIRTKGGLLKVSFLSNSLFACSCWIFARSKRA